MISVELTGFAFLQTKVFVLRYLSGIVSFTCRSLFMIYPREILEMMEHFGIFCQPIVTSITVRNMG